VLAHWDLHWAQIVAIAKLMLLLTVAVVRIVLFILHYACVHMQIPGFGKNMLRKQLQYDSSYIDTILDELQQKTDDNEVCSIHDT
jgi:hypothetical protein